MRVMILIFLTLQTLAFLRLGSLVHSEMLLGQNRIHKGGLLGVCPFHPSLNGVLQQCDL